MVSIELKKAEPELLVEEKKQGYQLSLSHTMDEAGLILELESLHCYRVIDFSQEYQHINRILTKKGLLVPRHAKDKVIHVIQNAKRDIKIHADVGDIALPEMTANAALHLQLLPVDSGIIATIWVKPTEQGYCKIAQGKQSLIAMVTQNGEERRCRVKRNFDQESKALNTFQSQCPTFLTYQVDSNEYSIDDVESVLECLSELMDFKENNIIHVEWPEGEAFKIKNKISSDRMSLNVVSQTNWFEYEGEVRLSEDRVITMQALLDGFDDNMGRFIRLGKGEFIELTHQLHRQLNLLRNISNENKVYHLSAQVLSDIVQTVEETTFDKGWENYVARVKAMKKHTPKIPSTLQAELRDYQAEGFQYLSRLTHWGIGACLADDMGLGKTIQAITLILERTRKGASLIIAPTSVCFNWIEEFNRFAPSLNVHTMNTSDREQLIKQLTEFDVLICSYGLLHYNADALASREWETIVLDEAQAIKNAYTKRWKAVMQLRGKNRVALTGTPIENHLGELWSIFGFINPGLLGNAKQFQSNYAIPIETHQSADKITALRSLVKPYILRRIKSEVLTELPPKMEQTIYIEPTEDEVTFYEALRRSAVEKVSHMTSKNNRISILAEINTLRQACCDSRLVDSDIMIENSKVKQFRTIVKNIIDNGHKALVFSQYVRFLSRIKTVLDEDNLSYQYLDGSTSIAKRKKAVKSFQAGDGDLFLLSLKAGGSGLNLTAADYVVHLDPWWNPAVEDQASDRAHRIGQERPVTIYRLVMKNTIEEKIIGMHKEKRHLATELLSGQASSGKLTDEDLINLMAAGAQTTESIT